MYVTYRRHQGNLAYWQKRWAAAGPDTGHLDLNSYPGKYISLALEKRYDDTPPILEAGCGGGRVLKALHAAKETVIGSDLVVEILQSIHSTSSPPPVCASDIRALPFLTDTFSAVFAFGLYHNLSEGIEIALEETHRVLKADGILCASFRADSLHNRLIDRYANRTTSKNRPQVFHKINVKETEIREHLHRGGFDILEVHYSENMPLLYKYPFFRSKNQRMSSENLVRGQGYQLSTLGSFLHRVASRLSPQAAATTLVVIARARVRN